MQKRNTRWKDGLIRCTSCKEYKSIDEFYITKLNQVFPYCKPCDKIRKKEKNARDRVTNQEMVDERLAQGCYICGEKDSDVLEFHHYFELRRGGNQASRKPLNQKYQRISTAKLNKSPRAFKKSIDTCYVLCANDHKRVHKGRFVLPNPLEEKY